MINLHIEKYIIILLYVCYSISQIDPEINTLAIETIEKYKSEKIIYDVELFNEMNIQSYTINQSLNDIYIDKHLNIINLGSYMTSNSPYLYNYDCDVVYTTHLMFNGDLILTFYIFGEHYRNIKFKYDNFQLNENIFRCPIVMVTMFNSIKSKVIDIIAIYDKIHLTGFGLGANIAQLFAVYISENYDKKLSVITFSSLNIWKIDFISLFYNSTNIKYIYNIYHINDINHYKNKLYLHFFNSIDIQKKYNNKAKKKCRMTVLDYIHTVEDIKQNNNEMNL